MLIKKEIQSDILIFAFRYSLGRKTYATSTVVDAIKFAWPNLRDGDKLLYKREIRQCKNFGMEVDKKAWLSILELE